MLYIQKCFITDQKVEINRFFFHRSNMEQEKYLCQSPNHDKQIISYSCTTCSAKICDKCQITHSCANKSYINVTFNEKLQEIQPLCKKHKSLAKFYVQIVTMRLCVCIAQTDIIKSTKEKVLLNLERQERDGSNPF